MITTILSVAAAFMLQVSEPVQNDSFVAENNTIEVFSAEDKCLGEVNLCDPDGNNCDTGTAYQDSENGRIYVELTVGGIHYKCYAQKSNNPNWEYMIRRKDCWYYFSF